MNFPLPGVIHLSVSQPHWPGTSHPTSLPFIQAWVGDSFGEHGGNACDNWFIAISLRSGSVHSPSVAVVVGGCMLCALGLSRRWPVARHDGLSAGGAG